MRILPLASRHDQSIKKAILAAVLAAFLPVTPSFADSIDSLKGQFTFDWFSNPAKAKCAAVDDKRLAQFKSQDFTCDLNPITNTASGKPARVCTQAGEKSEYLVFASRSDCEEERQTQESNSEE
jgi:hypothetical protein